MKSHQPLIGILTNILNIEEGPFAGLERIFVNRPYVESIVAAGGIPLMLPLVADQAILHKQIEAVDGILLPGGQDVCPSFYGEQPSPLLEKVCTMRDVYEMAAVKYAHSLKKPVLGICRGHQVINVAFGGTLHQDIGEPKQETEHEVLIDRQSRLFHIFGDEKIITNSYHHQAVKDIAPGFVVNARTGSLIEGIEKMDNGFVLGVQWHPEVMGQAMNELFRAFVTEASRIT